jgi:RimJ/RimL family protein N-acetyltransferase
MPIAMPLLTLARQLGLRAAPFEFLDPGEPTDGELRLRLLETAPAYADRAPTYRFEMLLAATGESVGSIELRIGHSSEITRFTGHIGYRVESPWRGRRFAARGCRILFPLARRHGFADLWITCDHDNAPSFRTCELVGGVLIETLPVPKSHAYYQTGSRAKCRFLVKL